MKNPNQIGRRGMQAASVSQTRFPVLQRCSIGDTVLKKLILRPFKSAVIVSVLMMNGANVEHVWAEEQIWSDQNHIVVETLIEKDDWFPGVKSYHKVYWITQKQEYKTGTTNISVGGKTYEVKSSGDDFGFKRGAPGEGLTIYGKTATGLTLGIGPFINYKFSFRSQMPEVVNQSIKSIKATVTGCHDGFPSYRIYVNNKLIYYHKHELTKIWKLWDNCGVTVSQAFVYRPIRNK